MTIRRQSIGPKTAADLLRAENLFLLAIAGGVLLSSWNLWTGYSYWFDELISVVAAKESLGDDFARRLVNDVHPPLYKLILWLFVHLFGDAEAATRALSLFFSLATLVVFAMSLRALFARGSGLIYAAAFLATSPLFIYYSQETRSYALMMFLSTSVTVLWTRRIASQSTTSTFLFYGSLVALSLTHFFGTLLSSLILLAELVRLRRRPWSWPGLIACGVPCVAWIAIGFVYGNLGTKTGGEFWIESRGFFGTWGLAARSVAAPLGLVEKGLALLAPDYALDLIGIWMLLLALNLALTVVWTIWGRASASAPREQAGAAILLIVVSAVLMVSIIDLHTPVSTGRNYIVIVPQTSILVGLSMERLLARVSAPRSRGFLIVCYAAILITSFGLAAGKMFDKWAPLENYKGAVDIILSACSRGASHISFYFNGLDNPGALNPRSKMENYYLSKQVAGSHPSSFCTELSPVTLAELPSANPDLIQVSHQSRAVVEEIRSRLADNYLAIEPHQSREGSVILFIRKTD